MTFFEPTGANRCRCSGSKCDGGWCDQTHCFRDHTYMYKQAAKSFPTRIEERARQVAKTLPHDTKGWEMRKMARELFESVAAEMRQELEKQYIERFSGTPYERYIADVDEDVRAIRRPEGNYLFLQIKKIFREHLENPPSESSPDQPDHIKV